MTTRYPFALIREELTARGDDALDFAIGQRRIRPPEAIGNWIQENAKLAMRPAAAKHVREFTEAAADLLWREYDVDISANHILPTPGGRAAMSALVASVLEPGDHVLVTEPGYPAFARLATHRHATIHQIELDPANNFAPDLPTTSCRDAEPARVIALNYPNNPTGATLSPAVIAPFREVTDGGTILFNDATYGPLVYAERPRSLLHKDMTGFSPNQVVELHSFSKLFPIGPVAISFLAGSEKTIRSISTYSEFAWSPLSLLQLQATAMCLRDSARLRELREIFPARLERLQQTLVQLGFQPYPAPAGVYLICRLPALIAGKSVQTAAEAAALLMKDYGLAVVPWDTPQQHYLRFSALYRSEDLEHLASLHEQLQIR